MTSLPARLRLVPAWSRTAVFAVAVLASTPHALRPPAAPTHPGFTESFAWMAYALAPWSAVVPFAVMRLRWPALVAVAALFGAAAFWRSTPLAAVAAAISIAPLLEDWPASTVLALGVVVLGAVIAHDLVPSAKLLARVTALVAAASAGVSVFGARHRGAALATVAVAASIVVRVGHG